MALDHEGETDVWFRRRIIVPGHRVHLFVCRMQDVATLKHCVLAFRPSRDQAAERHMARLRLADWRSPAAGMAIHAVVDGLSAQGGLDDVDVFTRALAGMSAWAVTSDRNATHDGISVARFEIRPPGLKPVPAILVTDGELSFGELSPAYCDQTGCCLLWPGRSFEQAFVELDGELVELRLNLRSEGLPSLPAWLAEMERERLDCVLDAWLNLAGDERISGMSAFAEPLATSREIWLAETRLHIGGAFCLGRTLVLSAELPAAARIEIELPVAQRSPIPLEPAADVGGDGAAPTLYRAALETAMGPAAQSARLRVTHEGASRSIWIAARALTEPEARLAFHAALDWDTAEDTIVAELAEASIQSMGGLPGPGYTTINLGARAADPTAPLVVCPFQGNGFDTKATLLAMRLGLGSEAVLRIVSRGRPTETELQELRTYALDIGGRIELAICAARHPLGPAMASMPGDNRRAAIVLIGSGLFPRDADWWPKLATSIRRNQRGVFWRSPTDRQEMATAVEYRLEGPPFVVLGPRAGYDALSPTVDVFSFEGFVRHLLSKAAAMQRAVALAAPRIVRFTRIRSGIPQLGDVRLDDAIFDAARGATERDADADAAPIALTQASAGRSLRAS